MELRKLKKSLLSKLRKNENKFAPILLNASSLNKSTPNEHMILNRPANNASLNKASNENSSSSNQTEVRQINRATYKYSSLNISAPLQEVTRLATHRKNNQTNALKRASYSCGELTEKNNPLGVIHDEINFEYANLTDNSANRNRLKNGSSNSGALSRENSYPTLDSERNYDEVSLMCSFVEEEDENVNTFNLNENHRIKKLNFDKDNYLITRPQPAFRPMIQRNESINQKVEKRTNFDAYLASNNMKLIEPIEDSQTGIITFLESSDDDDDDKGKGRLNEDIENEKSSAHCINNLNAVSTSKKEIKYIKPGKKLSESVKQGTLKGFFSSFLFSKENDVKKDKISLAHHKHSLQASQNLIYTASTTSHKRIENWLDNHVIPNTNKKYGNQFVVNKPSEYGLNGENNYEEVLEINKYNTCSKHQLNIDFQQKDNYDSYTFLENDHHNYKKENIKTMKKNYTSMQHSNLTAIYNHTGINTNATITSNTKLLNIQKNNNFRNPPSVQNKFTSSMLISNKSFNDKGFIPNSEMTNNINTYTSNNNTIARMTNNINYNNYDKQIVNQTMPKFCKMKLPEPNPEIKINYNNHNVRHLNKGILGEELSNMELKRMHGIVLNDITKSEIFEKKPMATIVKDRISASQVDKNKGFHNNSQKTKLDYESSLESCWSSETIHIESPFSDSDCTDFTPFELGVDWHLGMQKMGIKRWKPVDKKMGSPLRKDGRYKCTRHKPLILNKSNSCNNSSNQFIHKQKLLDNDYNDDAQCANENITLNKSSNFPTNKSNDSVRSAPAYISFNMEDDLENLNNINIQQNIGKSHFMVERKPEILLDRFSRLSEQQPAIKIIDIQINEVDNNFGDQDAKVINETSKDYVKKHSDDNVSLNGNNFISHDYIHKNQGSSSHINNSYEIPRIYNYNGVNNCRNSSGIIYKDITTCNDPILKPTTYCNQISINNNMTGNKVENEISYSINNAYNLIENESKIFEKDIRNNTNFVHKNNLANSDDKCAYIFAQKKDSLFIENSKNYDTKTKIFDSDTSKNIVEEAKFVKDNDHIKNDIIYNGLENINIKNCKNVSMISKNLTISNGKKLDIKNFCENGYTKGAIGTSIEPTSINLYKENYITDCKTRTYKNYSNASLTNNLIIDDKYTLYEPKIAINSQKFLNNTELYPDGLSKDKNKNFVRTNSEPGFFSTHKDIKTYKGSTVTIKILPDKFISSRQSVFTVFEKQGKILRPVENL